MINVEPVTLESNGVRLEPMTAAHVSELARAAQDGALWNIRVTSVPAPGDEGTYVNTALEMRAAGSRLPFVVRELAGDKIIGTTSYHDIMPTIDRVEIGYTWYAKSWQRTHVNASCKLMLLEHAFDTLGCKVVGFRTDNFNHASQAAIERLGAKRDGVIRHHALRRDGTIRDTVMYSIVAGEWPEVRAQLHYRLARNQQRLEA
ncbi:N-acetyltransferase [Noviherbaspirillum cavernae]|uniref:N-acetyltransferase n=1 Tax=Noviherbaspirillum cavernae TaxID=2320862 RepID=A0A418WYW7_9BURK|nr:GNAT family protein [Noviherbaspirillum cavernae]RJG05427.1 N-acetyltransferase [Noviherbaspirillum cavernae]